MIIYRAVHNASGKTYIGLTTGELSIRIGRHLSYGKSLFTHSLRKHGLAAFTISVIDSAASLTELNEKERFWIAHYNCKAPNGFNLTDGGGGVTGWKASPETCRKISAAKKGHPMAESTKLKLRKAHLGLKASDAARAKMSASRKGVPLSKERAAQLRAAYANWVKINGYPTGRKLSQSTRDKIGLAHRGRRHSSEAIERMRQSKLGTKASESTKRKLSEIRTKHHLPSDELVSRYLAGETTVDLGTAYGCSDDIIAKHLRRAGVPLRTQSEINIIRYQKNLPEDLIIRRFKDGESVNRIAQSLDVARNTIKAILLKHGLKPRSISAAQLSSSAPMSHNKSGYRGVSKSHGDKWVAIFRREIIGYYKSPEEAAAAYNDVASAYRSTH